MSIRRIIICLLSLSSSIGAAAHGQNTAAETASVMKMGNIVPGLSSLPVRVKSMRDMRYANMVPQEKDFTCGAAALATILRYVYGRPVQESEIIEELLKTTSEAVARQRGFSLLDMKNYVERLGLRGRGYQVDRNSLRALKIPVIALQNTNGYAHFVVIKRVASDTETVYIADPVLGHRQMTLDEFAATWNGIVFAVVGNGLQEKNILRESAKPIALPQRAGVVTQTLPPQREFGLLGMDSF